MIRLLVVIVALTSTVLAQDNKKYPGVEIADSELRKLTSANTGRHYHIYVGLPGGYSKSTKTYPVLYLLDGQWDFKLLASIYGGLRYDQFIPDMIIVGITYGGESPNYERLRALDYSPSTNQQIPGSGDGPKFLSFLRDELIPFVEENYRADPGNRTLGGSSFGGLFVLYALFEDPSLFQRYISTSPYLGWDNRIAFRQEAAFSKTQQSLPVRLFLSVGELEARQMVEPIIELEKVLRQRNYKGLKMDFLLIKGERHAGVKPEAFNRGLRAIFR